MSLQPSDRVAMTEIETIRRRPDPHDRMRPRDMMTCAMATAETRGRTTNPTEEDRGRQHETSTSARENEVEIEIDPTETVSVTGIETTGIETTGIEETEIATTDPANTPDHALGLARRHEMEMARPQNEHDHLHCLEGTEQTMIGHLSKNLASTTNSTA